MSDVVISVENIFKLYRLGEVGTGTLSHDLNRWWHKVRGKEDPYLKIGQANDRTRKGGSDYVWALKDVSFEVKRGEVLGIIGRNGAGKSTLLKILSRVTSPTSGQIKAKGRIASLLEVGTGFHPELTGRENIYLNGAILGMRKREMDDKFDEIVAFAEVDRYIDTPVKRYSSGMYVRLAFAVAAHLEPEILIVDEVLAVGDAAFQKKCLGKMGEVASKEGRTVLFVSHNIGAVRLLCPRCLLFQSGNVLSDSDASTVTDKYFQSCRDSVSTETNLIRGDHQRGEDLCLLFENGSRHLRVDCGSTVGLDFMVRSPGPLRDVGVSLSLLNPEGAPVMSMSSDVQAVESLPGLANTWRVRVRLGNVPLNAGTYSGRIYISKEGKDIARFSDAIVLEVLERDVFGSGSALPSAIHWGPTYWAPEWRIEPV